MKLWPISVKIFKVVRLVIVGENIKVIRVILIRVVQSSGTPLIQVNFLVQEEKRGVEIYEYLRVFIYNIPRKRIPGKYYLKLDHCITMDAGGDKQVLMEKMDRDKKVFCKELILNDLEYS